jgi:formylglycine-generating enzyme required for sulfatase activity
VFYVGHLEAFDWRLLGGNSACDPVLDLLFEAGIDPEPGQLPQDPPSAWPCWNQVTEYVQKARELVDGVLAQAPLHWLEAALEHRWMHHETFTYMLQNLPLQHLIPPPGIEHLRGPEPDPRETPIEVLAGPALLGRPAGTWGWDNEFALTQVDVPAFRIGRHKVTNGEYLRYMEATGAPKPHYWIAAGGTWKLRAVFSEIELPLEWPVYVTRLQASAYAAWQGKRLPTEAEFHRAAFGGMVVDAPMVGNAGFKHWDPVPETAVSSSEAWGVGNGWEWTSSPWQPLPGFQPFAWYPGYSANFFDDDHFTVKGGGPRTAVALLRSSFRNWFREEYPYAHISFRCAESPQRI